MKSDKNKYSFKNLDDLKNMNHQEMNAPKDYFEHQEDNLFTEIKLQKIKNQSSEEFQVPKAYFDQLQADLESKINPKTKKRNCSLFKHQSAKYCSINCIIIYNRNFISNKRNN